MNKTSKNLFLICMILIVGIQFGCRKKSSESTTLKPDQPESKPKLTVGIQVSPAMTLVMVAEDMGFFDNAGVDVEIVEFTAGKFALQAFLGGSLDIAISGEVPVALSTLQGNKFRVIAQVVERTVNECRVIVRKETGMDTPEKYFGVKKRRLATSFGGGPEFFTYEFFKHYNIDIDKVELISQKPEDMPAALTSGSVDAISIFDPFARIAEVKLGDKGQTFANADIYSELYVADVMQTTIDNKSDLLVAFLKGLYDAQFFINDNIDRSKEILIKYTKLDRQIVDGIWNHFVFKPAINDLFIDYTTAQAEWAIEKGTFPKNTTIPNYRSVLYPDLLQSIDPEAVKLTKGK